MITPIARLTALIDQEPVVVVGFDATDALCVFGDGHIEYVPHTDLRVVFFRDLEAAYWLDVGGQVGETEARSEDEVRLAGPQPDAGALPPDD